MQHTAFSVRVIRIQRTSDTSVDITFERLLCVANSKFQIWGSSLQVQKDLWKSSQHISSSSLLSLRCSPRMRAARRFSHSELGSAGPRPLKERRPYGVWDQRTRRARVNESHRWEVRGSSERTPLPKGYVFRHHRSHPHFYSTFGQNGAGTRTRQLRQVTSDCRRHPPGTIWGLV